MAVGQMSVEGAQTFDQNTRHTQGRVSLKSVVSRMSGPLAETTQDRIQIKDTHPDPD